MRPVTRSIVALLLVVGCRSARIDRASAPGSAGNVRALTGFTAVEIGGALEVEVIAGQPFFVEVTGDPAAVADVTTRVKGEILEVGRKGTSGNQGKVKVSIKLPALHGVELAGASQARVIGLGGDGMRLEASGASHLYATAIKGEHLAIDASGASRVEALGTIDDLVTDVSGASRVNAKELLLRKVVVDVSGASTLVVRGKEISGDASGASTVQVWGAPEKLAVDTSGASSVRRM
jgi:hypothetical protein